MSVFWIASMWLYQLNISSDMEKHIALTLVKTTAQECSNLRDTLDRAFLSLKYAARNIDTAAGPDGIKGIEEGLQYFTGLSVTPQVWIMQVNEVNNAGEYMVKEKLESVLAGQSVVDGPVDRGGTEFFSLAVPVERDGSVVAVLGCTVPASDLSDDMLSNHILREGYRMIVSKENAVISVPSADAGWWKEQSLLLEENKVIPYADLYHIEENDPPAEGSVYLLGKGNGGYYLTACPLGVNDWTLLSAISKQTMQQDNGFAGKNLVALNAVMLLGFLVMLALLMKIWGRERRIVQEERNRFAWLEERYRIVARESDDVIFEISLQEKFIEANENFHKLLGYNVVQWNNEYLNRVHPDDEQKFAAIYEGIKAGKRLMKEELRFRRADGTYVWCRLLIAILFDSKGKPARALGKITNIDSQKREAAWLRQKAQQDALTNLYNKETTHNMIRRYLETEGVGGVHGLMVLDVDNFKEINDTRGHLYGDAVLAAVADKLRMQFRSTDIVGRIGGDEFLVFLKNVNSRTQLETQAAALQHAFASGKELDYRISCSIGAATYPEDGAGIDLLFQNADTALYRAKRQGKGRYAIFRWDIDARQQTEKPRSVQPESKEQSDSGEGNDIQQ